jgi:hypothetical protein
MLIESSKALRKYLGDHLSKIKRLDPLPSERQLTAKFRKVLVKKHGKRCGYCGRRGKVEAAHIVPLEIGAKTKNNLILLCKPCHKAYDNGAVSIKSMKKVAGRWRNGSVGRRQMLVVPVPPNPTVELPPSGVRRFLKIILQLQSDCKYEMALDEVDQKLTDSQITRSTRVYLEIKRAELTRRKAAKGVVKQALRLLDKIDVSRVPRKYQPVFYYEFAYIHRLLGLHDEALKLLRCGSAALSKQSKKQRSQVAKVAGGVNEILCQVAKKDKMTKKEAKNFESKLRRLEKASKREGGYWGGRWMLNCAAHTLQIRLKAKDRRGSWKALKRLRNMYLNSDIKKGWDIAGRQTLSQLEGLVRVLFPNDKDDLDVGVGLLARSVVTRLGNRQRPEGIRDTGLGLEIGLRKRKKRGFLRTAGKLKNLMSQTLDGTSVLWPYRKN